MNKIFRVIYNEARNCCVVVSELTKCHSKGRDARHLRRGGDKHLRLVVSLLLTVGGAAVQQEVSAETFTGKPGTYADFVSYDGEIITPTGKSVYTFAKGAKLDNPKGENAFQVDDSGQDVTIHVGKADGHPYDFEAIGYNRSFRNINTESGNTSLTIDDVINGKSVGADYHFRNDEKSREIEGSGSVKTLFFYGNSKSSIKGHSVTIDSARYRDTVITPDKNSHGILSSDAKSVIFDLSGDFKLDNEQRGIYMTADSHDNSMEIHAQNIQITCTDPNENLSNNRIGVSAYGNPYTSTLQMTSTDAINISGYRTALQGLGYVNMSLKGKRIELDGNPADGKGLRGVYLNGASPKDSKVSLQSEDQLIITGGTGESGYGMVDVSGLVDGQAKNLTVSGSQASLYADGGGEIDLKADTADYQGDIRAYGESRVNLSGNINRVTGQVGSFDGSSIVFNGKDHTENGTLSVFYSDAPTLVTGIANENEKHGPSSITVNQNAIISNRADAADTSYQDKDFQNVDSAALLAMTNGKITLKQAQKIYGNIMADVDPDDTSVVKSKGGTIDLTTVEGGEIKGNISAGHSGVANITLAKGDWEGRATDYQGTDAPGMMNLTMQGGSIWHMKGDSSLTSLNNTSSIVDMKANGSYQTLNIGQFSGQDGTFLMKTDLDSQTYGDKVHIGKAVAGSQGRVQVYDKSFLTGKEVTGVKNLLLITDASRNAVFTGASLDKGGLWDVTPTLQRGNTVKDAQGNIVGKDTEWYLTKLEKKVNKDTIPLMKAADNSYALYRLDIDSLRKRMGDLRFRNMKDDSGLWARDFHGAYEGQGTDSRYNGFQLGYDYAANEKSLYGFFAERTISNPKYSYGSSKDHGLSGGLYGTWFGDSGVYTDVVAKWGRNDTELHTRGGWPDSANYRTRSESLSVEWGKTFTRDDGLFLEPEAQMIFGRLGSKDYTTSRGRTVHMGSYDSAIGRLGILLGKRVTEGDHPYDYYLKFSLLHEFGGERNFHLAAPDGETMDYSEDYRDTWQEAGFGGTWHINGNTSIYADAERSFNGSWHKKWQWNLGINWQF